MKNCLRSESGKIILTLQCLTFLLFSSSVFAEQLMVVNFDTTQPVPISPTLSGFNLNEISNTWQFEDPIYQANATALKGKMFRFPGGGEAGRYDWHEGDIPQKLIDRSVELGLSTLDNKAIKEDQAKLRTKGGVHLLDFYESIVLPNNAKVLITLNTLTDFPQFPLPGEPDLAPDAYAQSAKDLATYVKDHNIEVAYYDLLNEPYLQGKLTFWSKIATELNIARDSGETLGHYNGRVYMTWVKKFSDAIKSVTPTAKTVIKPAPVKNVAFTFNGETDPIYQQNFNQAIWDFSNQNGIFYDAMSIHWYPCLPLGAPVVTERDCIAGSPLYLETIIRDYYIANNQSKMGRGDMPILITEMNLAADNPVRGTMFNGIYLAESILRNARISQFGALLVQVMSSASSIDRGAFRMFNQTYWMSLPQDAYESTSQTLNSSLLPFQTNGLISFTTYQDHLNASGQPVENAVMDLKQVSTLPNASTTAPFQDYRTYFNAHGAVLQVINEVLAKGTQSYPGIVIAGSSATVPVAPQPTTPIDTGLGTTILTTNAVVSLGILDSTGKRYAIFINKSDVTHKIRVKWSNVSPGTSSWTKTSVSSADYMAKNSDSAQTNVAIETSTINVLKDSVSIPPYSVTAIRFDQ